MKLKFAKPKKVNKKAQKKKADILFSLLIRSYGQCEARDKDTGCKCGGGLQCAHLITRGNHRLRWDMMNALSLCAGHHRFFTHRPLEWSKFLQDNYKDKYDYVMVHKNELWTGDYTFILKMLEGFSGRQQPIKSTNYPKGISD